MGIYDLFYGKESGFQNPFLNQETGTIEVPNLAPSAQPTTPISPMQTFQQADPNLPGVQQQREWQQENLGGQPFCPSGYVWDSRTNSCVPSSGSSDVRGGGGSGVTFSGGGDTRTGVNAYGQEVPIVTAGGGDVPLGEARARTFTGTDSQGNQFTLPTIEVDSTNPGDLHNATAWNVGDPGNYTHLNPTAHSDYINQTIAGSPLGAVAGFLPGLSTATNIIGQLADAVDPGGRIPYELSSTNQLGQQVSASQPGFWQKQSDGSYGFVEDASAPATTTATQAPSTSSNDAVAAATQAVHDAARNSSGDNWTENVHRAQVEKVKAQQAAARESGGGYESASGGGGWSLWNKGGMVGYNAGGMVDPGITMALQATMPRQMNKGGMYNHGGPVHMQDGGVAPGMPMAPSGMREGPQHDTTPAMLTPGEFVLDEDSTAAIQKVAPGFLDNINQWEPAQGMKGLMNIFNSLDDVNVTKTDAAGNKVSIKSPEGSRMMTLFGGS